MLPFISISSLVGTPFPFLRQLDSRCLRREQIFCHLPTWQGNIPTSQTKSMCFQPIVDLSLLMMFKSLFTMHFFGIFQPFCRPHRCNFSEQLLNCNVFLRSYNWMFASFKLQLLLGVEISLRQFGQILKLVGYISYNNQNNYKSNLYNTVIGFSINIATKAPSLWQNDSLIQPLRCINLFNPQPSEIHLAARWCQL